MVKCLIVDDEPLAQQILEKFIEETPGFELVAKSRNAFEAFELISSQFFDLVFLDIEMPLMNGVHFLKSIKTPPKTIFTTAYKEYAFEGFELNVIDYLLKPFSYQRFLNSIKKYQNTITEIQSPDPIRERFLLIKDRKGIIRVRLNDILYVEGNKDYVRIVTNFNSHLMLKTMGEALELLGENFVRVHRSFIVPLSQIKNIQSENLILNNNKFIPVGDFYKKQLLELFKG